MLNRKDAIFMVVASVLATSSLAMADSAPKTSLTLDPSVITADAPPSEGLLMMGLGKAGAGQTMKDLKLNIYGWVETGYTYDHRHGAYNSHSYDGATFIQPGPFNHEYRNHLMLNQFVLRFERQVDTTKFDVGGMVELMYGSDAAQIHASGLGYNGTDATDDGEPDDDWQTFDNLWPTWQFDIPQAYLTINLPVGNGLKLMVGKFVTLLGYETIDPRGNPFYSHSDLNRVLPFTHTGILGSYQVNDQLGVKLGITRGWDIATEDNNSCAIDVIGQVAYQFNKQLNMVFNFSVGPENGRTYVDYSDSGHYRVALDPIIYWQVTDALKLGLEGLYIFDGGWNTWELGGPDDFHHYGDVWGAALYAGYKINDNFTVNARLEKVHASVMVFAEEPVSAYEATLGVTITPMPKDPYLKGLMVRPEVRYDFTDSTANKFFEAKGTEFKDQLTFGCDVIFQF